VTERYVLGNQSLRPSSFGTPESLDPASGKVRDWTNDVSARAAGFASSLKPGEVTYAAECYLTSPESPPACIRAPCSNALPKAATGG